MNAMNSLLNQVRVSSQFYFASVATPELPMAGPIPVGLASAAVPAVVAPRESGLASLTVKGIRELESALSD
jgi:hypothetical protein